MAVSILIPWRTDHGPRERVFNWALPRWEETGLEIVVGTDTSSGPFSRNRALNDAARNSSGDVLALFDADCVPDPDHARSMNTIDSWQIMFSESHYLSQNATESVLDGADPLALTIDYSVPFQSGHMAVRRAAWEAIGGFDEEFHGWGCADIAIHQQLMHLYGGSPEPCQRVALFLHHPVAPREHLDRNKKLLKEKYRCD